MKRTEIRVAGFGGQGVILCAMIIGKAASIHGGRHVVVHDQHEHRARARGAGTGGDRARQRRVRDADAEKRDAHSDDERAQHATRRARERTSGHDRRPEHEVNHGRPPLAELRAVRRDATLAGRPRRAGSHGRW